MISVDLHLAILFLTNLPLQVVNFQHAEAFAEEVEALRARSLFSVDELDDCAFLSLQALKDPNYSQPIEDFLVKYAFARKRDKEPTPARPPLAHLHRSDQLLSNFNSRLSMAPTLAEDIDPFRSSQQARAPAGFGSSGSFNRRSLVEGHPSTLHPAAGSQLDSKLTLLNNSYQQYFNYLNYQRMLQSYYQLAHRGRQEDDRPDLHDEQDDERSAEEEAPQKLVCLTPAEYYRRLLSLEVSTARYRGRRDLLTSSLSLIQAFCRGWIVRKRLQLKDVFERCCRLIQAVYRGSKARRRVVPIRKQVHRLLVAERVRKQQQAEQEKLLQISAQMGQDKSLLGAGHISAIQPVPLQSDFELKVTQLEKENIRMREKLDQQSELLLNLLANQSITHLNTSNKLLGELKEDISCLKENNKQLATQTTGDREAKEDSAVEKPQRDRDAVKNEFINEVKLQTAKESDGEYKPKQNSVKKINLNHTLDLDDKSVNEAKNSNPESLPKSAAKKSSASSSPLKSIKIKPIGTRSQNRLPSRTSDDDQPAESISKTDKEDRPKPIFDTNDPISDRNAPKNIIKINEDIVEAPPGDSEPAIRAGPAADDLVEPGRVTDSQPADPLAAEEPQKAKVSEPTSLQQFFSSHNRSFDSAAVDKYEPQEDDLDAAHFMEKAPEREPAPQPKSSVRKDLSPVKEVLGKSGSRASLNGSRSNIKPAAPSSRGSSYSRSAVAGRSTSYKPNLPSAGNPLAQSRSKASFNYNKDNSYSSAKGDRLDNSRSSLTAARKPLTTTSTAKKELYPKPSNAFAGTSHIARLQKNTAVTRSGVSKQSAASALNTAKPSDNLKTAHLPKSTSAASISKPAAKPKPGLPPSTSQTLRSMVAGMTKDRTSTFRR